VVLRLKLRGWQKKTKDLWVRIRGPPGGKIQKKEHQDAAQQARKHVECRCAQEHGEEEELSLDAKNGEWAVKRPVNRIDSSCLVHALLLPE
jgi:hypothetical protein